MSSSDYLTRLLEMRRRDRKQMRFRKPRVEVIPDKCSQILKQLFQNAPQTIKHIDESRVIISWGEIVGEAVARVTTAQRIRDGKLFVKVADPLWRSELSFQKTMILKRMIKAFPRLKITDIFFTS